ncbi:NAD-dependent succinate-semialdehyde dehydrogenase [Micromonospora sp. CPCC 206061]|uniref:NAD-dependent succinate-semialdehyde dehydrogenase n=1 Tax=Micromonospora sp. CPCC 206061 TaxID=3122410 RepID=UPI002FF291E6
MGDTFPVLNPSTGEVITDVPRAGLADLDRAVAAAQAALPGWDGAAPRERSEVLRRAFELMISRRDEIAHLISLEMGKALADARAEVTYAAEFFRWFAEEAVRVDGHLRTAPSGANRILTFRRPVGVALLITPWNFPAAMATRKIGPALAAGCPVILKPAEDTPLTALFLADLLAEAGAPDGTVGVLATDRPAELVAAALADRRVRKLSFTGSTGVGRDLLRLAADRVVNASMELGGNDPFIVLDDADLGAAVDGAMLAKMRNGGQACTAANRFLVQDSVADEFAARLAAAMAALRVGPGTDERTQLGPMVNARAADRIASTVERTVAAGARTLTGGTRADGPGFFYPATVLTDVPRDAPAATTEIFGPVAPIIRVRDERDAVALANDTELGLAAYVYSGDLARGLRVAERLEFGMVGLNRGLVSDPAAPFGGVKQAGLGREGGYEGIGEYLETTYVATTW